MCVMKVVKGGRCRGGGRGKVVVIVIILVAFVGEEVHLVEVRHLVIRGKVVLEGDGGVSVRSG